MFTPGGTADEFGPNLTTRGGTCFPPDTAAQRCDTWRLLVLLRKLAEDCMDGVDVRDRRVGDVLDLPPAEAQLLVAKRWAIPERRREVGMVPAVERRKTSSRAPRFYPDGIRHVLGSAPRT